MPASLLVLIGDIHGDTSVLSRLAGIIRNDDSLRELQGTEVLFLQLGDMAFWWPKASPPPPSLGNIPHIAGGHIDLVWVPGNHDNFDVIESLAYDGNGFAACPGYPDARVARPGAVLSFGGKKVLLVGKATSIDKEIRLRRQLPWWPQEELTEAEIDGFPETHVDWVCSHSPPACFRISSRLGLSGVPGFRDTTAERLDRVFSRVNPERWFFAHFHMYATGSFKNCLWTCLADSDDPGFLTVFVRAETAQERRLLMPVTAKLTAASTGWRE